MWLLSRVRRTLNRGQSLLSAEFDTVLTNVGQDYPILGTFIDSANRNFTTSAAGEVTLTGIPGWYAFNGVSNVKSNKVATINYTLFENGVAIPGATTPNTFSNANSYANLSITNIIQLHTGDVLDVRAKSNTISTTLTVYNLMINLIGPL